jgi:hypothetical protein
MNQDSGGTWAANAGMPSPQMIYSVLDQLFHVVGAPGSAVTIYVAVLAVVLLDAVIGVEKAATGT